jgi:hypothetical protein
MRNVTKALVLVTAVNRMGAGVASGQFWAPKKRATRNSTASGPLTATDMDAMIAQDRKLVAKGEAPAENVEIDIELAKLVTEGQAIVAANDKVKAQAWSAKYSALVARRAESDRKWFVAHPLTLGQNPYRNDCLSPMGKDLCAPPPPPEPQQRMCTVEGNGVSGLMPC